MFALPFIVVLFLVTVSKHFNYTPDDTYIYLQFAKNIVHGNGVAFNAGEPTYGFTSPLWLLLISLSGKFGVDLYTAAKSLDLVLAGVALIVFYLLANEVIRDAATSICATVVFSLNIWFLRWTGTGMETSLSVALLLATILFCLRNRYILSIILAALLALTRPETIFLAGFIIADVFINSQEKRPAITLTVKMLMMYGAILAPWLIYAQSTFGTIIPNTAFAKAGFHFNIDDLSSTSFDLFKTLAASDGIALAVLIAVGILLPRKLKVVDADHAEFAIEKFVLFRQGFVPIAWILFLILFYVVTGANVVSRYLLLVTPLAILYAFWYLQRLMIVSRWSRFTYAAIFLLAAMIMLQNQVLYRRYVMPGMEAFQSGMELCLIPIGRWLHDHTPPETIVYTPDIGAIGFFSDRRICDGAGLVSPAMLALIREGNTNDMMMEQRTYESVCGAHYVVDRSFEPERWKHIPGLLPLMTRPFGQMGLGDERVNYYTVYTVASSH